MTEVTCGSIIQREVSDTGTVGQLLANHECKLLDDDGKEVGYDTPGEMCVCDSVSTFSNHGYDIWLTAATHVPGSYALRT